MKKIIFVLCAIALIMMLPVAALAEGGETAGELYTWAYLGTSAGATAATLMIVQLIKAPLDKVWRIPTRAMVYVVALAIMLLSAAFTGGLTWEAAVLTVFNAAVVALAAMGAYEMMFKREAG